jgi:hypothetical protein
MASHHREPANLGKQGSLQLGHMLPPSIQMPAALQVVLEAQV